MQLRDLKESITDLSADGALLQVIENRALRFIPTFRTKKAKAKQAKRSISIENLLYLIQYLGVSHAQ